MEATSPNPLISTQKSSQLQAILHPLALLTISDYISRHNLRGIREPIIGSLFGQQNGREITIEHAIESHVCAAPQVDGGVLLDANHFSQRVEQMVTVHKDRNLELVGWYTLLPSSGPSPTIIPIHKQILEGYNESAILLGFHPEEVLNHSVGGQLPLTIYESNYEVDDPKAEQDGEDQAMEDGEPKLKLKFCVVPYSVETDETEMIGMNFVAGGGGSAAATAKDEQQPPRSIESNGKGKRRLVETAHEESAESQEPGKEDTAILTRAEDEMIAALNAKANAIKMLRSRIQLLTAYLEHLPQSYVNGKATADDNPTTAGSTVPSLTVLRQIQALVSRLNLVTPSDTESYDDEMLRERNDVNLIGLLDSVMQSVSQAKSVGKKSHVVESAKNTNRRGGPSDFASGTTGPSAGSSRMPPSHLENHL